MAGKNPNVKKGASNLELTPEELNNFIKCGKDPTYFIENYIFIRHPVKGQTKFKLYKYQRDLIKAYHKNKEVITLYPRQSGKCSNPDAVLSTIQTSRILPFKKFILRVFFKRIYDQLWPSQQTNENTTSNS